MLGSKCSAKCDQKILKIKVTPKLIYTPLTQDVVIFFKDNMSFDFGLLDYIEMKYENYWVIFQIFLLILIAIPCNYPALSS